MGSCCCFCKLYECANRQYLFYFIHSSSIGKHNYNVFKSKKHQQLYRQMSILKSWDKKVNKLFYIMLLMVVLYATLLYLDIFNYYSLENIVSVIFGFLIMIILQLLFISYKYSNKMKQYGVDEVGIIKDMIKNTFFGEINSKYIAKKQKLKYYQYTKDENDKLFTDQNKDTFQCVMSSLRGKSEFEKVSISSKTKQLKEREEVFMAKTNQFQSFIKELLKIYKERCMEFKKFDQKYSTLQDSDFELWKNLFSHLDVHSQSAKRQLQGIDQQCFNFKILRQIMHSKYQLNDSVLNVISVDIFNEYHSSIEVMRQQFRKLNTDIQACQNQNVLIRRNYRESLEKINVTNEKIVALKKKMNNKQKGSENIQFIFESEYTMKFLQQELDNLQVKKTYLKDMIYKNYESQYKLYIDKQKYLDQSVIQSFNKKLSGYLVCYYNKIQEKNSKKVDKIVKQIKKSTIIGQLPRRGLSQNQSKLKRKGLKQFIEDSIKLTHSQIISINNVNESIKKYNEDWKGKFEGYKHIYEASPFQKFNDYHILQQFKQFNETVIEAHKDFYDVLKDLKNQFKDLEGYQPLINLRQSRKYRDDDYSQRQKKYSDGDKISTIKCLHSILYKFTQGCSSISNKKFNTQFSYQGIENKNTRRMNDYKDQIFKLEREDFQIQEIGKESQNEKSSTENSLGLINRILDVFASEWKNSTFFHEILKQEIEISLNTKRPPVLGYMTVKYIKLHKKQANTLEALNVLSDSVFICNFEACVNFRGEVAIQIQTEIKSKKIPVRIKLLIKQFRCPIQICYTPFCLGKSSMSMMKTPNLAVQYCVTIGGWQLTKIPFLSLFIEMFVVIKLRKKFLFPKKATMKVPMAVKNAISEAIKEKVNYEKLLQKKKI